MDKVYNPRAKVENEDGIYDIADANEDVEDDDYGLDLNDDEVEYDETEEILTEPDTAEVEETVYRTQEEFDRAFTKRLKRKERQISEQLGVSLEEAAIWIEAGKSVSEVSGLTPAQIKMKLEESRMQQTGVQAPHNQTVQGGDDVGRELARLREIVEGDHEAKIRAKQEAAAKQSFGELYDKYREDIEDKAEEKDLSLEDAAAIVLRPKLQEITEEKFLNKQKVKRARKIESGDEAPGKTVDYNTELSASQKNVARKMGQSLEKYYKSLKELEPE